MADKKAVVEVKKEYKVRVAFDGSSTATIFKPGLPFIIDKVEAVVGMLATVNKANEIEVVGERPDCWKKYFPDMVEKKEEATIPEVIA